MQGWGNLRLLATLVALLVSCRTPPPDGNTAARAAVNQSDGAQTKGYSPASCLADGTELADAKNVEVSMLLKPDHSPLEWATRAFETAGSVGSGWKKRVCSAYEVELLSPPSARVRWPSKDSSRCGQESFKDVEGEATFKWGQRTAIASDYEVDVAIRPDGCRSDREYAKEYKLSNATTAFADLLRAHPELVPDGGEAPVPRARVHVLRLRTKAEASGCEAPSRLDVEVWTKDEKDGLRAIADVSFQFDRCSDVVALRRSVDRIRQALTSFSVVTEYSSKQEWALSQ